MNKIKLGVGDHKIDNIQTENNKVFVKVGVHTIEFTAEDVESGKITIIESTFIPIISVDLFNKVTISTSNQEVRNIRFALGLKRT